jgi:hypothetical protein
VQVVPESQTSWSTRARLKGQATTDWTSGVNTFFPTPMYCSRYFAGRLQDSRGLVENPVDWSKIPEEYEEPDYKFTKDNYDFVRSEVDRL